MNFKKDWLFWFGFSFTMFLVAMGFVVGYKHSQTEGYKKLHKDCTVLCCKVMKPLEFKGGWFW